MSLQYCPTLGKYYTDLSTNYGSKASGSWIVVSQDAPLQPGKLYEVTKLIRWMNRPWYQEENDIINATVNELRGQGLNPTYVNIENIHWYTYLVIKEGTLCYQFRVPSEAGLFPVVLIGAIILAVLAVIGLYIIYSIVLAIKQMFAESPAPSILLTIAAVGVVAIAGVLIIRGMG